MINPASLTIACILLVMQAPAFASTVTSTLVDAGKTLDAADQGIRTFTERMNGLRQSKRGEFERTAAERIKIRLAPYRGSPEPRAKREIPARSPIDRFVRTPNMENWVAAKREVQTVLMSVMHLLQDVKKIHPDFVNDRVTDELSRFFDGDDSVESQLALMVPPSSPPEMQATKAVREKYRALRRDLAKAQIVMAEYVQSLPHSSSP